MNRAFLISILLSAVAAGGATTPPQVAGTKPFTAKVYDVEGDLKTVLFDFTREETIKDGKRTIEGRFSEAGSSALAVYEKIVFPAAGGPFIEYFFDRPQSKEKCWMRVENGRIFYKHQDEKGKIRENDETLVENMVTRDEVVGLVQRNWDALKKGEKVKGRFILPDRAESIGIQLKYEGEETINGMPGARIVLSASSPFVALVAKDTHLFFEREGEHKLLQVIGRQPVLKKVGDSLKNLRGRIEFNYAVATAPDSSKTPATRPAR